MADKPILIGEPYQLPGMWVEARIVLEHHKVIAYPDDRMILIVGVHWMNPMMTVPGCDPHWRQAQLWMNAENDMILALAAAVHFKQSAVIWDWIRRADRYVRRLKPDTFGTYTDFCENSKNKLKRDFMEEQGLDPAQIYLKPEYLLEGRLAKKNTP